MSNVQYVVTGGRTLSAGATIRPAGNKNAALPIVCAALLTSDPVTLDNVPRIRDIETLLDLVRAVGASVEWTGEHQLRIHARELHAASLDPAMCARIRASILLAGPLLARCGEITLAPPGGDVIGRRRLDTHFLALEKLGARYVLTEHIELRATKLVGADVFLDEPSVTGTENALVAAAAAEGTTVLRNAASEPHVQDLARFLVALGADIEGIGTNQLTVHGGRPLHGCTYEVGPDHIEVGSFIGMAAVMKSALRIERAGVEHLPMVLMGFERLGVRCEVHGPDLLVPADQSLRVRNDLGGHVPKIEDQPWPAFPADLMSIAIVVATQCEGLILVHEKMFESRMFFVDKLVAMGARIVLCDPHRALVSGPSALHGSRVESPDIRAGMAMLLAALAAKGTSVINNAGQIERGYERICDRLNALGAQIERREIPSA
ncbi:MAG TPA: UDP-N-acetylglucosamine 1-carboxyvinyltransferase [Gemmatimonadaceae bacterium]|nr:UDP-N-acetylglucosamine 1-carboxyvinyltransferase [Gemmatimonadaceae bacterium]